MPAANGASLLSKISAGALLGAIATGGYWAGDLNNRVAHAEEATETHIEQDSHVETGKQLVALEIQVKNLDTKVGRVETTVDLILTELRKD